MNVDSPSMSPVPLKPVGFKIDVFALQYSDNSPQMISSTGHAEYVVQDR